MIDFVASLTSCHDVAWDCATGNGQAATALARHYARVIATDASESQIANAEPCNGVVYRVASASDSGIGGGTVDLVTVAQAMHWLEPLPFFSEARRVLRPDGAVAIWGYGDPVFERPALHEIVHRYNRGTIEHCWKPERDQLLGGYRDIPFPFSEVVPPSLSIEVEWTLAELAGYLRTWSATAAYALEIGADPVDALEADLAEVWGKAEERHRIRWPLFIRAGTMRDN